MTFLHIKYFTVIFFESNTKQIGQTKIPIAINTDKIAVNKAIPMSSVNTQRIDENNKITLTIGKSKICLLKILSSMCFVMCFVFFIFDLQITFLYRRVQAKSHKY